MVKPASVTVTALAAASEPPVTVMTMELAPGDAAARVTPCVDDSAEIVPEAKKPDGYFKMIKLLVPSAPPAVGVNENVAAADVLPATRSGAAIVNEESKH